MYWEFLFDLSKDAEEGLQSVELYKGKVQFFDITDVSHTDPHTKDVSIIRRNYQDRSEFQFDYTVEEWLKQHRSRHYSYNVRLIQKVNDRMIGAYKRTIPRTEEDPSLCDLSECQLNCRDNKLEISGLWYEWGDNSQMILTGTLNSKG